MSETENFDIIIVGAGVLGVATAYYMQKNNPDKKILLLDRYLTAGQANTAMSAAAVRNMFASSTNQVLTDTSIKYFENVQEQGHDLFFEKCGYLWLLSDMQFNSDSVQMWMKRMETSGISYKVFDKQQLKGMIPGLNVDFANDEEAELMNLKEVSYGLFGADCGVLDPTRLVEYYLEEFKKLSSVKPRFGVNVTNLILEADPKLELPGEPYVWQMKRVNGVKTEDGKELRAGIVVLATGAWANELLDPIGLNSQTKAKKRHIFVIHGHDKPGLIELLDTKGFSDLNCIPFTILPSAGVYFRPQLQEKGFWIGCGDKVGREYKYIQTDEDLVPESAYYETSMYPVLSKYFPAFTDTRPVNSWAGGYCYAPDAIPFVYEECGVLVVNGASGSGIMKADAMARIADALYRGKEEAELFGGKKVSTKMLSIKDRDVEVESVVI
ncbi:MAG: FAD-binding oxidoreductase [Candidatus Thorarchaeota archaeon]